jgi:ubiquitin-conjugating enzyme E2 O
MRPLKHGEVGVSFLSDGDEREILPESALRLSDRTLGVGDYCKRNIDEVCSGVVTNVRVRGRVEHVITGEEVDGWWSRDDLEYKSEAEIGDHVVYDDWVGQVSTLSSIRCCKLTWRCWTGRRGKPPCYFRSILLNTSQVFDESVVEMSNAQLVRVTELGSRLNVGEKGSVRAHSLDSGISLSHF